MKTKFKIIGSLLIAFLFFAYLNFFSSFVFPWQKTEAIQTTLNWGGLAELPKETENLTVEKYGSIFSRSFKIQFKANQTEIESWILKSKRLKNNSPKRKGNHKTFDIYPGEDESFGGNVTVEKGMVTIRMSWS
jgi:hypothetical protein